jgi:hypothetical protein
MTFRPGVCPSKNCQHFLKNSSNAREMENTINIQKYTCLGCGCTNDAYGEGEDEGHTACEEEAPPWELHLVIEDGAEDEGHCH